MKTLLRTRTATILSAGAIGLLALSGCGGMDSGSGGEESGSDSSSSESQPADSTESEMPDESGDSSMADSDLVGSGCSTYAEEKPDGAGSVEGMGQDPVATAASNNPMLTTPDQGGLGQASILMSTSSTPSTATNSRSSHRSTTPSPMCRRTTSTPWPRIRTC